MTATTVRTAWTEAEIREALSNLDPTMDLVHSFWEAIGPLRDSDVARVRAGWDSDYSPRADHPGTLWADLRPSEEEELTDAIGDAVRAARARFVDDVRDRLVDVALRFDAAHPDVPRGHWRPAAGRSAAEGDS